jgi:Zn-dependent peptidase ImmA (M78 family)
VKNSKKAAARNGQMNKLLEQCLFVKNPSRFSELRSEAFDFRNEYIGDTIVRDGIFEIIIRYAESNSNTLKLLRYPIADDNIWAFTCVKENVLFVTINTSLALNKQIFAAAHELYHIYRFINDQKTDFVVHGSLLTTKEVDNPDTVEEDCEANAFAALVLAPREQIEQQQKLKGKSFTKSDLTDLISFMDTFALPYKAMVLKLFECKRYNEQQVDYLLSDEMKQIITDYIVASDLGKRWLQPTYENNLDALRALVEANSKSFVLPEQRISEDIKTIDDIVKELPVKK